MRFLRTAGAFAYFLADFGRAIARRPPSAAAVLEEAYGIGVRSLPVLLLIAIFVGTNLALQGANAFAPLGGQHLVGMFVALAGVREMAPVIAAAMIAAKAGTEMASQIAVMQIREQIDALEVMAVNPLWFLVLPRLLGIVLVLPALTILAIFVTLVASYAVVVLQLGQSGAVFLAQARAAITGLDFVFCMGKGLAFGVIIALVSCFFGFRAERGPEGVGRATNAAVVTVSVAVVFLNYLLSAVFYG